MLRKTLTLGVVLGAALLLAAPAAVAQTLTISGPTSLTETDENFATTYTITRTGAEFASQVSFDLVLVTADTTDQGDIANARLILAGFDTQLLAERNDQFTAQSADVSVSPTRITFAAGDDSKTFSVTVVGDNIAESAETFAIYFFPRVGNLADAVFVTINDSPQAFIASPTAGGVVTEGQSLDFVIRHRGPPRAYSTLVYFAITGTAQAADYAVPTTPINSPIDHPLVFDPATGRGYIRIWSHSSSGVVRVNLLTDAVVEGETLTFALLDTGVRADNTPLTFTIADAGAAPLSVAGPARVSEAHRDLRYAVSYTPPRDVPAVSVPFTLGGTATVSAAAGTPSPLVIPGGRGGETVSADLIVALAEGDATLAAEGDETVVVSLSPALVAPGLALAAAEFTTAIADSPGTAYLMGGGRGVAEGSTVDVFVGLRGPARRANTAAQFAITGTAEAGVDYEVIARSGDADEEDLAFDVAAATGSVVIAPGAVARGRIALRILSDSLADEPESLVITLTGHTATDAADAPLAVDAAPLTLTITGAVLSVAASANNGDRDPASADVLDVNEGDIISFSVTLSGAAPADGLSVDWGISGDVDAGDWSTAAGTLTFTAPGVRTVAVTAVADGLNEAAEGLVFAVTNLSAPAALNGDLEAAARIAASDPATYAIVTAAGAADVDEGGRARYEVTLSAPSQADIRIPLSLGGTATVSGADADLGPAPAGVTIAAGQTTAPVAVGVIDDALNEARETAVMTVGGSDDAGFAKGAGAGAVARTAVPAQRSATANIADNDPATATIAYAGADADPFTAGAQVAEGGRAEFSVTLSRASAGPVTAPYSIGGGITADDYSDPGGGQVVIAAGQLSATFAVDISLDGVGEPAAETLRVTLAAPQAGAGAGLVALGAAGARSAEARIPGNLAAMHSVFFAAVSGGAAIGEGDSAATEFTITRAGPDLTSPISIRWDIVHETTAAADLSAATLAGGSVEFADDETGKTITVAAVDDRLHEGGEAFKVELSAVDRVLSGQGGVALGAPLRVRVADNDSVWVAHTFGTARLFNEGATLSGGLRQLLAADAAGQTSAAFPGLVALYAVGGDGDPATPDLGGGEWRDHGGLDPRAGDPFPTGNGMARFVTGADQPAIFLSTVDDDLNEANEVMVLSFRAAPGARPNVQFGGAGASTLTDAALEPLFAEEFALTFTIADNDPLSATFAESRLAVDEGAAVELRVAFDRASAGDVTVPYTVTASGDLPPEFTDITERGAAAAGSIIIPAGETSGTIRLQTTLSETRTVATGALTVAFGALTADSRGGTVSGSGQAVVTVRYRQQQRTFAVAAAAPTAQEGGMARFTVTLAGAPMEAGQAATVNWAMAAAAGAPSALATAADLGGTAGGSVTFTDNAPRTIAVPIADDALNEAAETLRIALVLPVDLGGGVSDSRIDPDAADAEVTIAASDPLTYRIAGGAALESADAVFTAHLSRRSADAVTVALAVAGGSATAGAAATQTEAATGDFVIPDDLSITVPAGALLAALTVPLNDDDLNEGEESIRATAGAATAGPLAGAIAPAPGGGTAEANILDDDPVTAAIAAPDPATATEGGTAEFTVTLGGGMPTSPLRVFYSISGASITAGDYRDSGRGVLAFTLAQATPGQDDDGNATPAARTFTVDIAADALAEAAETMTIAVTGGASDSGGGVAAASTGASAAVTIAASTAAAHQFRIANPPARINEGDSAVFVVTRAGPAISDGAELTVNWTFAAAGAAPAAAADFAGGSLPAGGALAFSGDQARASFVIATAGDILNEADKTFALGLSATSETIAAEGGVAVAAETATVAIADDDTLTVTPQFRTDVIFTPPFSVVEGSGRDIPLVFDVTGNVATAPVEVTLNFSGPTYRDGFFDISSGRVSVIPLGENTLAAPFDAVSDGVITPAGLIAVTFSAESAGRVEVANSLTIRRLESSIPTVTIAADRAVLTEGEVATFTVASGPVTSEGAVTVLYTVAAAGSPAPAFTDPGGGRIDIPAGASSAVLSLSADAVAADSGGGTLTVTLTGANIGGRANSADILRGSGTAAVGINYLPRREISISHPGAPRNWDLTEGRAYEFPVTVDGAPPSRLSVRWAVETAGMAAAGAQLFTAGPGDFCDAAGRPMAQLPSGVLHFAVESPQLRQVIALRLCADNLLEPLEEFRLILSQPAPAAQLRIAGADPGRGGLALKITGAETPGLTAPAVITATEGGSAQLRVEFTGGMPGPAAFLTTTIAAHPDLRALSDAEAPQLPGIAAAGALPPVTANPMIYRLAFPDDAVNEPGEGRVLQISVANIAGLAVTREVRLEVADNDPIAATIARVVAPGGDPAEAIAEGGAAEFSVSAGAAAGAVAGADLTVEYAITGTGITADDYTDPGGGSIVIPANESAATLRLAFTADRAAEAAETLTVTLTGATGGGGGTVGIGAGADIAASATIAASGAAGHAIAITAAPTRIIEGAAAQFTVTRSGIDLGEDDQITVNWAVSHSGAPGVRATGALDFWTATGSVTFSQSNPATRTFSVSTRGVPADTAVEGDEAFTVNLSAGEATLTSLGGVTLGPGRVVLVTDATAFDPNSGVNNLQLHVTEPLNQTLNEGDEVDLTLSVRRLTGRPFNNIPVTTEIPLRIAYSIDTVYADNRNRATPIAPALAALDDEPFNGMLEIPAGGGAVELTLRVPENGLSEPRRLADLRFEYADPAVRRALPLRWAPTFRFTAPDFARLQFLILDNDPARVEFAAAGAVAAVEGDVADLPLRLTGAAAGSVAQINVPYTVAAAAGAGGNLPGWRDPGGGVAVIAAGELSGRIRLALPPVAAAAGRGDIIVTLGAPFASTPPELGDGLPPPPVAASSDPARIQVQFLPDDTPRLFSIASANPGAIAEDGGGGSARFTVATAGVAPTPGAPATVGWRVSGAGDSGVAATAADVAVASGRVTFTSAAPQTITIAVADDALNESAETLTIALVAAPGAGGGGVEASAASAFAIIAASDPVTVSISGGGVVGESAGSAGFTVTLSAASGGDVTAPLIFGGTATRALDYAAPGEVVIAAGQLSAQFAATVVEDSENEARESVTVTLSESILSGPGAGAAARASDADDRAASLAITDNDALRIAIAAPDPATVNEGETADFPIAISGGRVPAAGISLLYSVGGADITAADYAASGAFTATAANSTLRIGIAADGVAEGAEQLTVTLTAAAAPGEVAANPAAATVTIAASGAAARTLSITSAVTELTEGDEDVLFRVENTGTPFSALQTVTWRIIHGDTTAADFAAGPGEITLTANRLTITGLIVAADDNLAEGAENFAIALSIADPAADGGTAIGAPLALSIAASDPVTVRVSRGGVVNEGEDAVVNLALAGGLADLDVTWTVTPVTATAADVVGGGGRMRLAAGATAAVIRVPVVDDDVSEGAETFSVTVAATAVGGAAVTVSYLRSGGAAAFSIPANDPVTASFAAAETQARAGQEVALSVLLDRPADADTYIGYSFSGEAAAGLPDENILTIAAGDTAGVISFVPQLGARVTGMAQLNVVLGAPRVGTPFQFGARIGIAGAPIVVTVVYAAPAHLFSVAVADGAAATVDEGGSVNFVARLGGETATETLSVDWAVAHGGSVDADFAGGAAGRGGTLVFMPGERAKTVTVTIADDTISEPSEAFSVTLSNVAGADAAVDFSANSAAAVIRAGDPATYTVSGGGTAAEGGHATVTVTLSNPVSQAFAITPVIARSGAQEASESGDYSAPATVEFTAGQTSRDIRVAVAADRINEGAGGIFYGLPARVFLPGDAPPLNRSGAAGAAVDFTDDDPVSVGFSVHGNRDLYEAARSGGQITQAGPQSGVWRIGLLGANPPTLSAPVTVYYRISGTGIDINDLAVTAGGVAAGLSGAMVIPVGATYVELNLLAITQGAGEAAWESGTIALTGAASAGAAAVDSAAASSPFRIGNNDRFPEVLTLSKKTAAEIREPASGHLDVVFTVQRSGGAGPYPSGTYTWRIIGTGARPAEASDFAAVTGTVTDTPGRSDDPIPGPIPSSVEEFTVRVLGDGAREGAETFILRMDAGELRSETYHGTILPPRTGEGLVFINTQLQDAFGAPVVGGRVAEGGTYRVHVSLTDNSEGHAGAAIDYGFLAGAGFPRSAVPRGSHRYNLPLGQTSGFFTFTMPDDATVEGTQRGSLNMSASGLAQFSGGDRFTRSIGLVITDDDSALALAPTAAAAHEGDEITLPLRFSPSLGFQQAVTYTLSAGGARPPRFEDRSATPGSVTIPAGGSGSITLGFPVSNAVGGGGGTVTVAYTVTTRTSSLVLLPPPNTVISVTLRGADRRFSIALADPDAAVAEGGAAAFTVSLAGAEPGVGDPARVNWRVDFGDGSGEASAADITGAASGSFAFADTATTQTITLNIVDDAINEGAENLTVRLDVSEPVAGGGNGSGVDIPAARARIAASDPVALSLSLAGERIAEGEAADLTIALSGGLPPSADSIFVALELGGTAAADDFTFSPDTALRIFSFPADGAPIVISVAAADDNLNERAETLSVAFNPAAHSAPGEIAAAPPEGGAHSVTLAITDADPFNPQFAPAAQTVAEGGVAELTLTLAAQPTRAEEFAVTVTGVSAADWSGPSTLNFAAGRTSAVLRLRVLYDGAAESAETMTVAVGGASAAVEIPANPAARRAISVTGPAAVAEGVSAAGAAAQFTATVDVAFTDADAAVAAEWRIDHAAPGA